VGKAAAGAGLLGKIAAENTDDGSGKNRHIDPNRSSKTVGRINLRAVAEVLAERGVDPTVAILDILLPEPDENGVVREKVDADTKLRLLNELLQYTQPKLKSIEVRGKLVTTSFDVNDEQAMRIAQEFLKAKTVEAASS
jgi:hypothetical protein